MFATFAVEKPNRKSASPEEDIDHVLWFEDILEFWRRYGILVDLEEDLEELFAERRPLIHHFRKLLTQITKEATRRRRTKLSFEELLDEIRTGEGLSDPMLR